MKSPAQLSNSFLPAGSLWVSHKLPLAQPTNGAGVMPLWIALTRAYGKLVILFKFILNTGAGSLVRLARPLQGLPRPSNAKEF